MNKKFLFATAAVLLVHGYGYAASCSSFTPSLLQTNEYTASTAGQTALNICDACGKGISVIGYTDSAGNHLYQYDCGSMASTKPTFRIVTKTKTAPGCSGATITYHDCEYIPSSGSGYQCDNDYYWNSDGECVECPIPTEAWGFIEDGDKHYFKGQSLGGHACGYGTRESDSVGVVSCIIAKSDECVYCDDTGCFELTDDCPYSI